MKPKQPPKTGVGPKKRMPKWKRHLDEYRMEELVKLTFTTEKDLDEATALVWGGRLTGMAFALDPNGPSFVLPKASIPFFAEEGISFTEHSPCPPFQNVAAPKKNVATSKKRMPKWKRRLEEYRMEELVKLTFTTEKDLDEATALVWGGRLTGVAFGLDPNGPSFILPKASIPFFAEEGIKFTEHPPRKKVS
jgi:hypothetical protein